MLKITNFIVTVSTSEILRTATGDITMTLVNQDVHPSNSSSTGYSVSWFLCSTFCDIVGHSLSSFIAHTGLGLKSRVGSGMVRAYGHQIRKSVPESVIVSHQVLQNGTRC